MSVIGTSGPLPFKSGELSEVKRASAVPAQAPIQTLQAKDEVTLDPEKRQSNGNGSLPVFEAWNEVSTGGVDGRDRNFAKMEKPRNVADNQLHQANQDLGNAQNPSAQNNGNQSPQMVVQIRANQQKSPFPPGKDQGKDGGQGLPGQERGSNPLGNNGLGQATSPSAAPSAGRANGNHAFSPSQAGDSDFSVKKDESGKQKLGDSERTQRDVQEQSSRSALNNMQAGRDFSDQATGHGEARQSFHENADLNRQDGTQNLQQATDNTKLSKQAGEQGDLQKLLAKAQKMVQSMAKAQEAQGKAVETGGRATEAQGKATETTGQTIETTGHTTEANGHATEGTGVSMQGMGQSLLAAGAALVGGLFTAPVGAALMAQGGLLEMAGISTQMVGQGLQMSGQGLQAQGEGVQTVGKQVQDGGKKIQDQGKKTQEEAKKTEEEAKKKEDDHLQLFQKFAEEAKKLLEDAMQNKVDAGENFQKADENMELGQKEGDHRDQAVDQANEANKTAGQDNERADKASDNLRALNEVQQKLFGKDEGSQDAKREHKTEVGGLAPGQVKGSSEGEKAMIAPKSSEHREETDEEKDRRKKQNLNVMPLKKNSRSHGARDPQSKGEARNNDGQTNPMAANQGGQGGQGGQNSEGRDGRQAPPQERSEKAEPVGGALQAPLHNRSAGEAPVGAQGAAEPAPLQNRATGEAPVGAQSAAEPAPLQNGPAPRGAELPAPAIDAPRSAAPGSPSPTTGAAQDNTASVQAPGMPVPAEAGRAGAKPQNTGGAKRDQGRDRDEPEESSGLMEDPGFGQAGSDLPKGSGQDKEIEPVASSESKEGSATYDVAEDEASVRLNDLGDSSLKGSSLGTSGTGTSSNLGVSSLGNTNLGASIPGESSLGETSSGGNELAGTSSGTSKLGVIGRLRSL